MALAEPDDFLLCTFLALNFLFTIFHFPLRSPKKPPLFAGSYKGLLRLRLQAF